MRRLTVSGRLTKDAEINVSRSGKKFISFGLANNEYGDQKDANGNPITMFFNCTCFSMDRYEKMVEHLKKGGIVNVTGDYSQRMYQDKNGQWRMSNDLIADGIYFQILNKNEGQGNRPPQGVVATPEQYPAQQPATQGGYVETPPQTAPMPTGYVQQNTPNVQQPPIPVSVPQQQTYQQPVQQPAQGGYQAAPQMGGQPTQYPPQQTAAPIPQGDPFGGAPQNDDLPF